MKLIKLNDNFIIVSDEFIGFKRGEWCYNEPNNSETLYQFDYDIENYPLGNKVLYSYKQLDNVPSITSLDNWNEILEQIGEIDVETKAKDNAKEIFGNDFSLASLNYQTIFKEGYNQCLSDNKDKKYTEEDMISFAYECTQRVVKFFRYPNPSEKYIPIETAIKFHQPQTEWGIDIENNKIILL